MSDETIPPIEMSKDQMRANLSKEVVKVVDALKGFHDELLFFGILTNACKIGGFADEADYAVGMVAHFLRTWSPAQSLANGFAIDDEKLDELELSFRRRYLRSIPYKEYLQSPHWKETRLKALEAAGHKCQVCSSKDSLNVHHRTYIRIGHEEPTDLLVLCRRCHQLFHDNGKLARPQD